MHIAALLLVGLVIGTAGGLLGIGGGVLLVPVLTELLGFEHRQAAGITLAVLAIPVAFPGAWQYYRNGYIGKPDLILAVMIAIGFALGTLFGAKLSPHIPVAKLRLLFGMVLIYVAVRMMVRSDSRAMVVMAGLFSAFVAWLAYLGLLAIGKRYLPPPSLKDHIQKHAHKEEEDDIEYYI